MYRVTKTFGHELGLSTAFRQWRADSHCCFVHGYALAFVLVFEAADLDVRNWVLDFGGFKGLKEMLAANFDHKLLVAEDDPQRALLEQLGEAGVADVLVVPAVGCEMFARVVYENVSRWLYRAYGDAVRLVSVEAREHGANSATYMGARHEQR